MSYVLIWKPNHPNAQAGGMIREHIFVMAEMLGRPLTELEVVHHKDNNERNNVPSNLMLFASNAAHLKHHAEERALAACGNRAFLKCKYCKEYDDPLNMSVTKTGQLQGHHKACGTAQTQRSRAKKLLLTQLEKQNHEESSD